ncbi:MAG: circularly permuted type 2 ATP-grasp protein [Candidatus Sumerlaeia bacterium]|nr:circularly permuted type 2 ATP-grasp protein [Candidatus Sumerlaeia bacterium]
MTEGMATSRSSLAEGYRPPFGVYDELATPMGEVRPHWKRFLDQLEAIGHENINRRWDLAARLIREDDVYSPGHGGKLNEFWSLDLLPCLITPHDWQFLELAIIQRATLINQVLQDIHGPQFLIRNGVIPPDLIFAHPGFLRPCHGMKVPDGRFLHFYAADIGRDADGRFVVLADRTQAPSGTGYALENRVVITRTFPEIFRNFQVSRLIAFFQAMRETLQAAAPPEAKSPHVVILSPGSSSPTQFEHIHLARYLGYPLVEPADLTTRDNKVYVKTLNGLRRVDVLMRHVNDTLCDPLELRYESTMGVPGLVQAARAGNVAVVNALGSGIVGTYAFRAFMEDCSRALLGEPLMMPSLPTWWCGVEEHHDHVVENLENLSIKGAFRPLDEEPISCRDLSSEDRRDLLRRIDIRPEEFVAQETLGLSSTPGWGGTHLEPSQVILRVFAVAVPGGYMVMPGGVARTPPPRSTQLVSFNKGGGSKDVWVLSDKPVDSRQVLAPPAPHQALSRVATALPSRVADNLYWLGRYVERMDCNIRLLRTVFSRMTSNAEDRSIPELPTLMNALDGAGLVPAPEGLLFNVESGVREEQLLAAVYNKDNPLSITSTLSELRRIAWLVRDRLSSDTWRLIHRLEEDLNKPVAGGMPRLTDIYTILNQVVLSLSAFGGMVMESMTRGPGWMFLDIGRRLERAVSMITLLQRSLVQQADSEPAVLESVLEIADSVMTYRSRYLSSHQLDGALDLLILDEGNPRSVHFQISSLYDHVSELPFSSPDGLPSPACKRTRRVLEYMRDVDLNSLLEANHNGWRNNLGEVLGTLRAALPEISDLLTRTYFSHTEARHLGSAPETAP